jgi:hypothetical protein
MLKIQDINRVENEFRIECLNVESKDDKVCIVILKVNGRLRNYINTK